MDFLDAVKKLAENNPDVTYSECRSAMQNEVDAETAGDKSARAYAKAVEVSYERITGWLATGAEYAVTNAWRDLARFAASHRLACVWAVCISNSRVVEPEVTE